MTSGATMRRIEGTVTVPNYPDAPGRAQHEISGAHRRRRQSTRRRQARATAGGDRGPRTGDRRGSRRHRRPAHQRARRARDRGSSPSVRGGLPPCQPRPATVEVPFVCNIASGSEAQPSHPMLYGHGLLGHRSEANGGSTQRLRERGFSPCAVDWWGLSFADLPQVVVSAWCDFSHFPGMVDRMQQGFLNFMVLGPGAGPSRRAGNQRRLPLGRGQTADSHRRAVLRRQQPGRHHGRRPHRAGARLPTGQAGGAGHGLLHCCSTAASTGRASTPSSSRRPTRTSSIARSATRSFRCSGTAARRPATRST